MPGDFKVEEIYFQTGILKYEHEPLLTTHLQRYPGYPVFVMWGKCTVNGEHWMKCFCWEESSLITKNKI